MSGNNQNNDNLLNENILDEPISDDTIVDIELNDSISSTTSSEQCAICLDSIVDEQVVLIIVVINFVNHV